jgi:uncharacterized protein YlaI
METFGEKEKRINQYMCYKRRNHMGNRTIMKYLSTTFHFSPVHRNML